MSRARKRPRGRSWLLLIAGIVLLAFFLPQFVQRLRYPMAYEAEISAMAGTYSLPPALVAAIVNTESGFDRMAVSSVGAMGLMQIMPPTGEWIYKKLNRSEPFSEEMLYNPEINLTLGCWYLSFLLNRYDGDVVCAVSAYHAGQGNVDSWLREERYSDTGRTVNRFPDTAGATRHYVQKVLNAYEYYSKALEKQK